MSDPAVLALRDKMTVVPSPELTVAKPARQAILEVRTKDGRQVRHHTVAVRGTPDNPMPVGDVEAKAIDLLAPVIGAKAGVALIDAVWNLEGIQNINELARRAKGE